MGCPNVVMWRCECAVPSKPSALLLWCEGGSIAGLFPSRSQWWDTGFSWPQVPTSSRDFLTRVVIHSRACSHVPFQLLTHQLRRLLSLRECFVPQCLPAELPTGQFLHPECSGHDSPLNCLSLSCLTRAPQHPQQHLSCSGAVNYPGVGCNLLRFG